MTLLTQFKDWFVSKGVRIITDIDDPIDDNRTIGFVAGPVDDTEFACAALSSAEDGRVSVMVDIATEAAGRGALIALRIGDDVHVFDPRTVLNHGNHAPLKDEKRRERGEMWVYFDVGQGCRFDDWFDGHDDPDRYGDVTGY